MIDDDVATNELDNLEMAGQEAEPNDPPQSEAAFIKAVWGPYPSHAYKANIHAKPQDQDAVVYLDEARCKIIVRAGFNHDFIGLTRHLEGRLFVKKEETRPDGTKIIIDKYWEFSLTSLVELLRILKLCYKKISMPPLDLLWIWEELLEVEDMEEVYKIVIKRCPDDATKAKVDHFFKKHIDLSKVIIRSLRRIEVG